MATTAAPGLPLDHGVTELARDRLEVEHLGHRGWSENLAAVQRAQRRCCRRGRQGRERDSASRQTNSERGAAPARFLSVIPLGLAYLPRTPVSAVTTNQVRTATFVTDSGAWRERCGART